MIALELNNEVSTVRIHDDFFDPTPDKLLAVVSNVVTDSYKRRLLSDTKDPVQAAFAPTCGANA